MRSSTILAILGGAAIVGAIGYAGGVHYGASYLEAKKPAAREAIEQAGGTGVTARFVSRSGAVSRHPVLYGGEPLDEATRAEVARAVASIPGIGGVFWSDGTAVAEVDEQQFTPLHCQEDVEGLLQSRTIRFEEGSAALAPASDMLLDEVTEALRPCLGAIIAITGHTDTSGSQSANLALSRERALAVREALIARGIPRSGLRARGLGASEPVEGLAPGDPANRRIEFSVIATEPLVPTPVDTPGAR